MLGRHLLLLCLLLDEMLMGDVLLNLDIHIVYLLVSLRKLLEHPLLRELSLTTPDIL